jgi:hypothetical protein
MQRKRSVVVVVVFSYQEQIQWGITTQARAHINVLQNP